MTAVVIATVHRSRRQVVVSGRDLLDLLELAELSYTTTPSGSVVVSLCALSDVEAACAVRHRPIRIQSRRVVAA